MLSVFYHNFIKNARFYLVGRYNHERRIDERASELPADAADGCTKHLPYADATLTFAAPVTVLSGSQWVTQNGYTISFDLGKMMQAGGGEFMLISSMTQKDLSGTKEDPNYTEPVEEPKPMKEFNFTDVPKTYWAYDAIQYCANNEYISGYSDGSFKPNGNVTFAHLSKMLYFSGYNIERIAKIIDVEHYANLFMGWCVYRDIFLPEDIMTDGEVTAKQIDQTMTREQVTHALVQYAEWRGAAMTKPEVNIPDIDSVSPQYREAVQKAYRYGITNGKDAS